jgi:hypothetical protein
MMFIAEQAAKTCGVLCIGFGISMVFERVKCDGRNDLEG